MNRDKQIDGMIEAMSESCGSCFGSGEAECIYNAGYRKSSDVAREIFEEIEASAKVKYWRGGGLVVFEVNGEDFAELKKKYTEGGK